MAKTLMYLVLKDAEANDIIETTFTDGTTTRIILPSWWKPDMKAATEKEIVSYKVIKPEPEEVEDVDFDDD
jgi:hypothetical protein